MKKILKVKCHSCNDWGVVKIKNQSGVLIDMNCPDDCGGRRKSTDKWVYEWVDDDFKAQA